MFCYNHVMEERITTAGIALRNGKVLIAHRVEGGALSGKWEFPGGKTRYGETVSDTLRREWTEELGVEIETGEEILSFDFTNKDRLYHLKCAMVNPLSDHFSLSVHTEIRYVTKEELLSYDFGPSDRKIAEYVASEIL